MQIKRTLPAVMLALLLVSGVVLAGGSYDLSWHTVDGGGGSSSGGTYTLRGTAGQADAGLLSGGTYSLAGGFWKGATAGGVSIQLTAGWNLISFNVTPDAGSAITDVLAPVMSELIVAQGYDDGGESYYPGGAQNTLHTMDALHGYWLKVTGDTTLSIPGTKVASSTPISLTAGWNLVSYLPETPNPLATALASIAGKYTAVLSFEQGAESWYAVLPTSMNTLTTMYPRRGYWIYMTQAATLTYP